MKDNLPEEAFILNQGTLISKTNRFIRSISHRYITDSIEELPWQRSIHQNETIELTHLMFDYSELIMFGMQNEANALQQWENENVINHTLIYDKNYMRIYDVRTD